MTIKTVYYDHYDNVMITKNRRFEAKVVHYYDLCVLITKTVC